MYLKIIFFIITLSLLIGCSNSAEDNFLGKWERADLGEGYSGGSIEIVKNGDALLMVDGDRKYSANIGDDGTLQISGPFGIISYSYISESDTFIGIGKEYKRVK